MDSFICYLFANLLLGFLSSSVAKVHVDVDSGPARFVVTSRTLRIRGTGRQELQRSTLGKAKNPNYFRAFSPRLPEEPGWKRRPSLYRTW